MADKQKVVIQDDDYGIEIYVKKDTTAKPQEETKADPSKPAPEQLDEDALYEERPKVNVGQTRQTKPVQPKKTEETKAAVEEDDHEDQYAAGQTVEAQEPLMDQFKRQELEVVIMFKDEEFLVYNCVKQDWQLGDFNDSTTIVPLNAAIVPVSPQQTVDFHAISVGGRMFN